MNADLLSSDKYLHSLGVHVGVSCYHLVNARVHCNVCVCGSCACVNEI